MQLPVVYDDWEGGAWDRSDGRRFVRHIPTGCIFKVGFTSDGVEADLREGSATPDLFEMARGYFLVFGYFRPELQPPGSMIGLLDDDEAGER